MKFIKKHIKKIVVILLIIVIIFFVLKGCNNATIDEQNEFGYATIGDISRYIESNGVIKSDNGEIKSSVSGKVIKDNVRNGETVKKGDLLYKIDSGSVQDDINSMYQDINLLQQEYNELKKEISETNIIIDNNGIIENIEVNVGDEIKKGDPLAKILNIDKLILNVELNEDNLNLLKDLYVRKVIKIIVKGQEVDGVITNVNELGFDIVFDRVSDEVEGEKAKTSITGDEEYIIKYYDEVEVVSSVSGTITNINYKKNDKVDIGNILLSTNKGSSSELSSKGLELNKKRAELNKLRKSLDDYNVYATQDGVISKKEIKLNDMYDGSSTMCVISGSTNYYTSMQVSENDLRTIKEGQKVKIESKLLEDELEGEITNISYTPGDGSDDSYAEYGNDLSYYPVTISINDSSNQEIFNGMHVRLKIVLLEKKNILIVPTDAVLQGNYVYRVTKESPLEYEKVEVEVGSSDDESVEIKSGLKENDEVILYGINIEEDYYEEESEEE